MTINGGQPHRVGYAGQSHAIGVKSRSEDKLKRIGWLNPKHEDAVAELLRGLNLNPDWTEAALYAVIPDMGSQVEQGHGWCPGCGSTKTMAELIAGGSKYGCCPDRPGAPSFVEID